MAKINSGIKLLQLMKENYTGEEKCAMIEGYYAVANPNAGPLFPLDRKTKKVLDTPAEVIIDTLEQMLEDNMVTELTVEKARQLHKTGKYEPKYEPAKMEMWEPQIPDGDEEEVEDEKTIKMRKVRKRKAE